MDALRKEEYFTYNDYAAWDTDERYELIDGVPYLMSSPSQAHQEILGELFLQFGTFLKGKPCKVFFAPFDVRLNFDTRDDTVVQPDLLVICDESKLDGKCCNGAPDLVLEILSPSTSRYDRCLKFSKYRQYGVREYWIVDPRDETVSVYVLDKGRYVTSMYGGAESVPVHVLDGFEVTLADVFGVEEGDE